MIAPLFYVATMTWIYCRCY